MKISIEYEPIRKWLKKNLLTTDLRQFQSRSKKLSLILKKQLQ
jgi:hypothetical protein